MSALNRDNHFAILSYRDHEFLDVEFLPDTSEFSGRHSNTLIVGENATGKTRFLCRIIQAFRYVEQLQSVDGEHAKPRQSVQTLPKNFSLTYMCEGSYFTFGMVDGVLEQKKDGEDCSLLSLKLPVTILASTTIYNDKFPFAEHRDADTYQYCGIRETSNASWNMTLTRKTIDNLLSISSGAPRDALKLLFKQLDLECLIRIKFRIQRPVSFREAIRSPEVLLEYVLDYSGKDRRMQVEYFRDFTLARAKEVYYLLQTIEVDNKNGFFEVNIDDESTRHLRELNAAIDLLRRVGLLNRVELQLYKKGGDAPYSYTESSSGETQLLFGFSSIIRHAKSNSLIIIDEPEISLHPNWQIRYFPLLRKCLSRIKGCHVVIASHSHFLVSDLSPDDSSLLCFRRAKKAVKSNVKQAVLVETIGYSTYAWSPENILYSVFNVRTVGNLAFQKDMSTALDMIGKGSREFEKLTLLHDKLSGVVLDDSDPLREIVDSIKVYLDANN